MDKLWLLDNAVLTHQPGTQSDADKMSEVIANKSEILTNEIMVASYQISEEELRKKLNAEDGIMKIIN